MLVIAGGRERTEAEYHTLFEAAGFKVIFRKEDTQI
jgi:hypothetical protein